MSKFRQKALSRLKSPEDLDEPLRVLPRRMGWTLTTVLVVTVVGLLWGVYGRLPIAGKGKGILLTPGAVVAVQCPADGQLAKWLVSVGDRVEKDQAIGVLHQPAFKRALAQLQAKLGEVKNRNKAIKKLRDHHRAQTKCLIDEKRGILQARIKYKENYIKSIKLLAKEIQTRNKALIDLEASNLKESLKSVKKITEQKKQRMLTYERLRKEKLASKETARVVRSKYEDSVLMWREIELQIKNLKTKSIQLDNAALETRDLIVAEENSLTQLIIDLRALDNEEAQLEKKYKEEEFKDESKRTELSLAIERQKQSLDESLEIRSEFGGRILELTVSEGSVVSSGQRLAQIDKRKPNDELLVLAYFRDSIGKRLSAQTPVRVAPSTIDRARFGSIRGTVIRVSTFPVSEEAVANYIGSQETARQLTTDGQLIEVQVRLTKDPSAPSGLRWTSDPGPSQPVKAGTVAEVWVTSERRSPLSFVIPFLRKWTGL